MNRGFGLAVETDAALLVEAALPTPSLGPTDVVVAVRAVDVSLLDAKWKAGTFTSGPPGSSKYPIAAKDVDDSGLKVLGAAGSGDVIAVGADVPSGSLMIGDEVFFCCDIQRTGCLTKRLAIDFRTIARKPIALAHHEVAHLPLAFLTAYEVRNLSTSKRIAYNTLFLPPTAKFHGHSDHFRAG
eukprot:GHVT01088396.1.p1 GENE.GHVT01088396.1~~GHVT01088396.1.p1  ORF type:complete len:184 (-),score=20.68 GHVT01088396.1:431-982(-)